MFIVNDLIGIKMTSKLYGWNRIIIQTHTYIFEDLKDKITINIIWKLCITLIVSKYYVKMRTLLYLGGSFVKQNSTKD